MTTEELVRGVRTKEMRAGYLLYERLVLKNKKYGDRYKPRRTATELAGGLTSTDKNASKMMQLLAYLMLPFNAAFSNMVTTLGSKVYWPDSAREDVRHYAWWTFSTRAHEGQHLYDWPWLVMTYGLPHVLCIIPLIFWFLYTPVAAMIGFLALAALIALAYAWPSNAYWFFSVSGVGAGTAFAISWGLGGYLSAVLFGSILLILSPALNYLGLAYLRMYAEVRAYTLDAMIDEWRFGKPYLPEIEPTIPILLSGSIYYYAMPYKRITEWAVDREKRKYSKELKGWPNVVRRIIREQIGGLKADNS